MSLQTQGVYGDSLGKATAAANTTIDVLVPPKSGYFTRISTLRYLSAGTAHTITMMRSLGTTTVASTAASGQAVVNLTAQPQSGNDVAANDYLAIRHSADGVTRLYKVLSVSSLAITLTANLSVACAAGDKVWFFGVSGDTDPVTGSAHPVLAPAVSTTTTFTDTVAGVSASHYADEPIMLTSSNATAAGEFDQVSYAYTVQ